MSDTLDLFSRLAADFTSRVDSVPASAWENQSPCSEWKARDVVAHVVGGQRHFLGLVNETPAPADQPDDVAASWKAVRSEVEAALADPDRAGKVVETPFGAMPYGVLIGRFLAVDVLVHTWDLARAAGLDETIDADAVAHAFEGLKPMDAMMRGPGMFNAKVTPPAGADLQTQFLCFLGREV